MSGFGVRGRLEHLFAVVGLCALLGACGNLQGSVARPTATAAPQVRFTADWSQGLSGWQATPGWTVTNGALETSTADGLALTIPYQPPSGDYTVELDLQVVSVVGNSGFYILDVASTPSADGYQAGVVGLRAPGPRPNGDHPTITTSIMPIGDQDTVTNESPVADFEPGDGIKTYRIRVSDSSVLLYVDGRFFVVASSTKPAHLAPGPLVLKVSSAHLHITGLRVIA
jgi:hypothetical protein